MWRSSVINKPWRKQNVDSVYTERAILLAIISKMYHSHFRPDENEEEGFQHVLCIHISVLDKTLTWHIADRDLVYFRRLLVKGRTDCGMEWFDTDDKYRIMESMI